VFKHFIFCVFSESPPLDIKSKMHPPATLTHDLPLPDEPLSSKVLPWQELTDPSPTHLANSIPSDEPVIAHVPSWVNNLSYSHITETGSPYVSPQTTVIPQPVSHHKNVFSLFPEINGYGNGFDSPNRSNNSDTEENQDIDIFVTKSDNFPMPWETVSEDCPIVSHMAHENGTRTDDFLHSNHNEQAPDHHHVIIPTNEYLQIESSNSSGKHNHGTHLTEVASAPDFHHWRPIAKSSRSLLECEHIQSDTMLSEMAFVDSVKGRIQDWLKSATDDEDNDADGETEDEEDDGLGSADEIEQQLDKAMSMGKKH